MKGNYFRFWLINEQGLYIFDQKLQRQKVLTKSDEDKLIAELYNDPALEMDDTAILHKNLPSFAFSRLYYQKYKKDLYILLADEMIDITEIDLELQTYRKDRDAQRENLIGIVVAAFDDARGPRVVYSPSFINEETTLLLAVQGQTISYMGKLNEFQVGFKEPLNVPNRSDLIHVSYDFLVPAPNSKDPRIALTGRVMNLFLLFPRDLPYLKEKSFLQFIESFIDEWVRDWIHFQKESEGKYPVKWFDDLLKNLRSTVNTAIDLATHDEREIRKLKDFVMDILAQNQVLTYQVQKLQERVKELEGK
ncbi:MAG: hypothetical protein ACW97Z_11585 [Candidatus Hodarchaeales archaeon]|jgi:hypothetical protein